MGAKSSSPSTPATHIFLKSYSQTSKRARTFWSVGRVCWRESSKVETTYQEHKLSPFLYRNFPLNFEKNSAPEMWQDNHIFSSQRISKVTHRSNLDKKTYFTDSHTDNGTWPTGMTENFPADPSMHQSSSYLQWHIPVNKAGKYRVIFILPGKNSKGGQKTYCQGIEYRECPCQSRTLEA